MLLQGYLLAVVAALSCLGYGFALARILGIGVNLGDAGILGLISLALAGCAIHFAWALSSSIQLIVMSVGLALGILFRQELIRGCRMSPLSMIAGISAFLHMQAWINYDNGLYHLPTIKWNTEFPIVAGLANLHGRLAFNSTLFLMSPLDDRAEIGWVSNLILLMFVLISCTARFRQLRRHSVEIWFVILATGALGLLPERLHLLGVWNADGFAAMLVVYWFCIAVSLPSRSQADIPLLLLIAVLALTVKLSAAPLLPLALLVLWFYRKAPDVQLLKPALFAGVFLGSWMARGMLLSGCAMYPFPQSCRFNLPWAVSRAQIRTDVLAIRSWARIRGRFDFQAVVDNWDWLTYAWVRRSWEDWSARLFAIGGSIGAIAILGRTRVNRVALSCGAALCLCVAYWFISAPDVRFGSGYLDAFGILGLSFACATLFQGDELVQRLTVKAMLVASLLGAGRTMQASNTWKITDRPPFTTKIAPGGKPIAVPLKGDQCWDHPLPCTPYFHPEDLKRVRWR